MPSPTETLFLVQLSPVPTQTVLWLEGSIVTAPIDCTLCRSNTGLNVVAPLIDFHTPPLAEPAKTVIFPSSSTASIAAMRPAIVAEPMFLAERPEMVPQSEFTAAGVCAETVESAHRLSASMKTENHSSLREQGIVMMNCSSLGVWLVGLISQRAWPARRAS